MSKVIALLKMMRPFNSFMTGVAVIFSCLVNNNYVIDPGTCIIGFMTGFMIAAASMYINDYVDVEVDKINKPWKPLPQGIVSRTTVLILSITMLVIGILINYFINIAALITATVLGVTAYMYSFFRKYWPSHFLVSLGTLAPIVYGYVIAGAPRSTLLFTVFFATVILFINTAREIVKSIADIEGDKRAGYSTAATKFGCKKAAKIALAFSVIGVIIALIPGFLGLANIFYTIVLGACGLAYIVIVFNVYRRPVRSTSEKSKNAMIKIMFIALIGYLISQL